MLKQVDNAKDSLTVTHITNYPKLSNKFSEIYDKLKVMKDKEDIDVDMFDFDLEKAFSLQEESMYDEDRTFVICCKDIPVVCFFYNCEYELEDDFATAYQVLVLTNEDGKLYRIVQDPIGIIATTAKGGLTFYKDTKTKGVSILFNEESYVFEDEEPLKPIKA